MTSSNSFSAWKTVDDMVSKPIIGSDGAASWQEFQKSSKEEGNSRKRHFMSTSNAPQMPTKRGDKLATGFQTLAEERANEEKIRKASGEASVGSGYTTFKQKKEDEVVLSETEPRIRPDNMTYFIAAEEFEGWKEDYVFTTRHRGTGYYWDGMDSLRKQMGTFVYPDQEKGKSEREPKKKKKKKKKKKGETKENDEFDATEYDPYNPNNQIANAIKRRDDILLARSMGYSNLESMPLHLRQSLQNNNSSNENNTDPNAAALAAAGWVQVTDPSTKKVYYCHTKTRETKWEYPLTEKAESRSKSSETKDSKKELKEKLPHEWKSAKDSNGKEYYYNVVSKETTWKRPI